MGRKELTRQKILAAAKTEFGREGFEKASTNAVAASAGVSKGAVFQHFPTKADLFFAVLETELDAMVEAVLALDFPEGTGILEKIFRTMVWKLDYAKTHPEATRVMVDGLTRPPKGIEARIYGLVGKLSQTSLEGFFADLPMEDIRPEFSRADVMRNLKIAFSGLQAAYVENNPDFALTETARKECFEFIESVYRGMEKSR